MTHSCPQIFIDPINRIIGNYLTPNNQGLMSQLYSDVVYTVGKCPLYSSSVQVGRGISLHQ